MSSSKSNRSQHDLKSGSRSQGSEGVRCPKKLWWGHIFLAESPGAQSAISFSSLEQIRVVWKFKSNNTITRCCNPFHGVTRTKHILHLYFAWQNSAFQCNYNAGTTALGDDESRRSWVFGRSSQLHHFHGQHHQ